MGCSNHLDVRNCNNPAEENNYADYVNLETTRRAIHVGDIPFGAQARSGHMIWIWNLHETKLSLTLHSPIRYNEKGMKNFPWIPTVWCWKLVICLTSCAGNKFGHFRQSKIWQPWWTNFGNPENKNSDSWVFQLPEQEYGVRFHFQGCHLFSNSKISSYMGPLKMKICSKYQKYAKNLIYHPYIVTGY